MVERLRVATWEEFGKLCDGYRRTWRRLPHGGVPKGQLPTEPDRRTVPDARDISSRAAQLVQFRIPEIEPSIDPTYAWTEAAYAPLLWAISDGVFAVATRSLLSPADYDQLSAPWREVFGEGTGSH
jgi:hypothetical protein